MLTYLGKSDFPAVPALPAGARAAGQGTGNPASPRKWACRSDFHHTAHYQKLQRVSISRVVWVQCRDRMWNNPSQRCWVVLQLLGALQPPERVEAAPTTELPSLPTASLVHSLTNLLFSSNISPRGLCQPLILTNELFVWPNSRTDPNCWVKMYLLKSFSQLVCWEAAKNGRAS